MVIVAFIFFRRKSSSDRVVSPPLTKAKAFAAAMSSACEASIESMKTKPRKATTLVIFSATMSEKSNFKRSVQGSALFESFVYHCALIFYPFVIPV